MSKFIKTEISYFNKNRSKEAYTLIINNNVSNYTKCKDCNGVIYYYDSIFRVNRNGSVYPDKKSFLTKKILLNNEYYLSVCEDCLLKKFPEYNSLNKSKVFNRICDITCYAFNIPIEISQSWKRNNYSITLETLQSKYGNELGEIKWKSYCDKQAKSNTLEYKKEKYGWDEKQFKKYNKSRAVTINNLVKKHGETEGLKIWNEYCDKQRYSCSLEYFIKTYGDTDGLSKFNNFVEKRSMFYGYSNISQKLFDELNSKLKDKYTLYYATKNKEYYIINEKTNEFYFLDCYIKELNLNIEFNGDVWHANPEIYNALDKPLSFLEKQIDNYCASTIWEKDKKRMDFLNTKVDGIIVIWERDLTINGLNQTIDKLLDIIKHYENKNT